MSADEPLQVSVRVIPRSKRDIVDGTRAGRLVVRTTAAPVDDQANEAVRRLVAEHFGVRASRVELVSGHRSRDKVVRVHR